MWHLTMLMRPFDYVSMWLCCNNVTMKLCDHNVNMWFPDFADINNRYIHITIIFNYVITWLSDYIVTMWLCHFVSPVTMWETVVFSSLCSYSSHIVFNLNNVEWHKMFESVKWFFFVWVFNSVLVCTFMIVCFVLFNYFRPGSRLLVN